MEKTETRQSVYLLMTYIAWWCDQTHRRREANQGFDASVLMRTDALVLMRNNMSGSYRERRAAVQKEFRELKHV